MSFSSIVKNELCRLEAEEDCCLKAELHALIAISGALKKNDKHPAGIRIVTENAALARRIFSIIKRLYHVFPEVVIKKCRNFKKHISYTVVLTMLPGMQAMFDELALTSFPEKHLSELRMFKKNCCRKSFLRGAFLAGGSISDPEKTYHLEINCHSLSLAEELKKMINRFQLHSKIIRRKGNQVAYIKEGSDIVDFLNIIGAHHALMELENLRILKDMRNNVNRIVNCETANLEKTVNASVRQVEKIRLIKNSIGFESLPENLREIAELRLINSEANLKELGEMLSPVLGKSGVNHRLRKLEKIADTVDCRNME